MVGVGDVGWTRGAESSLSPLGIQMPLQDPISPPAHVFLVFSCRSRYQNNCEIDSNLDILSMCAKRTHVR